MQKKIDLSRIKKIHFVGIKGIGMAAIAVWAKEKGIQISGSDIDERFPTDDLLKRSNISWKNGFKPQNIPPDVDLVIVTGAHGGMTNCEAKEAKKRGIPTIMQGESLGVFTADKSTIAVSGSHGKTTTTALIAHLLVKNDLDPSYIVGCGHISSIGAPAHAGRGRYFVVEADEYLNCPITDKTPKYLYLRPSISIITNIEFDHPDAFKDQLETEKIFTQFSSNTELNGIIICCIDNQGVKHIESQLRTLRKRNILTYGFTPYANYNVRMLNSNREFTMFSIDHGGKIRRFTTILPGEHNVLNATASIIAMKHAGLSWKQIGSCLKTFTGTKRRFELIYQTSNIKLYDDYAHHPSEIIATLKAARDLFPKNRIIAIFQPHTFSRTKALFYQFSRAFKHASVAVITDIYASAREQKDPLVSAKNLVRAVTKHCEQSVYCSGRKEVINYLQKVLREGDIVIALGAGDIYTWLGDFKEVIEQYGRKD